VRLALACACWVIAMSGVASADDTAPASDAVGTAIGSASGAEIYRRVCQGCHMPEGQGAVGAGHYPKLAGDAALVSWEYAALTILNGKNDMPAFAAPEAPVIVLRVFHLSDANVADVVNYVRSHFGNKWNTRVTAAEVAALPHTPASQK
jgi:mono/diheme cytochrome c family protein